MSYVRSPVAPKTKRPPSSIIEPDVAGTTKLELHKWVKVKPIHCHQRLSENTLITQLRVIAKDKTLTELWCKFKPEELLFFYDHDIDHLPGMLEVCTMRQAALALAHLVYGAPMDYVALLDWMNIKLYNYGELDTRTIIRYKLIDFKKTPRRFELSLEGLMIQGSCPVMSVEGKCVMLSPDLGKEIRFRKRMVPIGDGSLSVDLQPGVAT